jgi:hypothetical protein
VISVLVLHNSMDLLKRELGSSVETRVTSTLDGNDVIGTEAERVAEVADQETATVPAINTEPSVSCVPAPVSLCPCETKI